MSLEDLNEKLKAIKEGRNPAAVEPAQIDVDGYIPQNPKLSYGQVKTILPVPEANLDTGKGAVPGAAYSSEKVVGGRAPDYSGYNDLVDEISKYKPKDTSTADLIAMGLTTGIGAMYGQLGPAATVAGKYGSEKSALADKRQDDFQKQLMAIRLARAQSMAKGQKGIKVKSGAGSTNWRGQVRVDEFGRQRWMTKVDPETGVFVPDESDKQYTPITVKPVDLKNEDGSIRQEMVGANMSVPVGSQAAKLKNIKNAEDQTVLVNERNGHVKDLGNQFNQTSMKLTPDDQKAYDHLRDKKVADKNLMGIKGSYDDIVTGVTALGRGDIGGMKVSLKMLASALEKGRMTSDADLRQVSDMGIGWVGALDKKLSNMKEGDVGIEEIRKQMESAYATLQATAKDAYHRRLETYNSELRRAIPNRRDLEWGPGEVPQFGAKKQSNLINKSISTAKDLVSTGEREDYFRDESGNIVYDNGKPVRAKFIRDPQSKRWIAVERVN